MGVYVTLYLFAYIQLFLEFQAVHMLPKTEALTGSASSVANNGIGGIYNKAEAAAATTTGLSREDQWHIALFLFMLSYFVYCTSKVTHYDLIHQLKRLQSPASCLHCVVTLGFMVINIICISISQINPREKLYEDILQLLQLILYRNSMLLQFVHLMVNLLYGIPLLIVAFSVKTYEYSGLSTYLHLTFTAILSGFVFAVLETRKPWPTRRLCPPFYLYENNARAKVMLGCLQVAYILGAFYGPLDQGGGHKIPERDWSGGKKEVLLFCGAVAFVVLHLTKTLVHVVVDSSMRPDLDDVPARPNQLDFPPFHLLEDVDQPPAPRPMNQPQLPPPPQTAIRDIEACCTHDAEANRRNTNNNNIDDNDNDNDRKPDDTPAVITTTGEDGRSPGGKKAEVGANANKVLIVSRSEGASNELQRVIVPFVNLVVHPPS
jgi:hypothetical protein